MASVHVENVVRDFDSWKAAFDKFEAFRAEHGVRAYRLARSVAEPDRVFVDLDFDSTGDAEAFRDALLKIWRTPQSQEHLVSHAAPEIVDVIVHRSLS